MCRYIDEIFGQRRALLLEKIDFSLNVPARVCSVVTKLARGHLAGTLGGYFNVHVVGRFATCLNAIKCGTL